MDGTICVSCPAPPQKWWPEDRYSGPIVAVLGVAATLNLHSVFRVADVIPSHSR